MRAPVAAALIIGNEVLTAKVEEANGAHLIRRLREHGLPLCSVHVVPDDVDAIVEALALARRRARWVFTSGGIGPTHDDVTVRAVALALGRRVVVLPEMEALLTRAWGKKAPSSEAWRLAEAPEGSRLLHGAQSRFPVLACDDVYLLPGVPELFRAQLELCLAELPGAPVQVRELFLSVGEPEIAHALDAVALALPHVAIGSYPTWGDGAAYRVKLTVEHVDAAVVTAAVERLVRELPEGCVLRLG
jgi:molybdenum cofactor synthesis domain-containing protein